MRILITLAKHVGNNASAGILALAALAYISAFYPGYLTADSLYMLNQSTGLEPISSWHSPTLVVIWGWLVSLYQSSAAPWLAQIALFMYGSWRITRNFSSPIIREITLILLLIAPPIFTNMAALWKDNWVQAATLVFMSLAIESFRKKSRSSLLAVLISALIVVLIRPDYIIIIMPALLLLFRSLRNSAQFSFLKNRPTLKALSIVVSLIALSFLPNAVPSIQKISPLPINMIWDIAGMKSQDGYVVPGYRCETSDGVVFGETPLYDIQLPGDTNGPWVETSDVAKDWILNVVSNPNGLLRHKICVASAFFNFTSPNVHYAYPSPAFFEQPYTNISERSQLNVDLYWFFDDNSAGPLWRAGYYVLLAFSLLILLVAFKRRPSFEFKIVLFSIIGSAMRVLILPATDFRYALWIPVATIILIGLTIDFFRLGRKRLEE